MPVCPSSSTTRISQDDFKALASEVMRHVFDIHNEFGRLFDELIYDVKLCTDSTGTPDGYICAGSSTFKNQVCVDPSGCWRTAPPTSFGFQDFETPTRWRGCNQAKLVEVELNGTVVWYKTYGKSYAWFDSVIQTSDVTVHGLAGEGLKTGDEVGRAVRMNPGGGKGWVGP